MTYECDNDNHDIGCQCPGVQQSGPTMNRQIIRTIEELAQLPVGSVVMTLWDTRSRSLHYVMQKYIDGWYGHPSVTPLYPLGCGVGTSVLVLWNPDIETEPT